MFVPDPGSSKHPGKKKAKYDLNRIRKMIEIYKEIAILGNNYEEKNDDEEYLHLIYQYKERSC